MLGHLTPVEPEGARYRRSRRPRVHVERQRGAPPGCTGLRRETTTTPDGNPEHAHHHLANDAHVDGDVEPLAVHERLVRVRRRSTGMPAANPDGHPTSPTATPTPTILASSYATDSRRREAPAPGATCTSASWPRHHVRGSQHGPTGSQHYSRSQVDAVLPVTCRVPLSATQRMPGPLGQPALGIGGVSFSSSASRSPIGWLRTIGRPEAVRTVHRRALVAAGPRNSSPTARAAARPHNLPGSGSGRSSLQTGLDSRRRAALAPLDFRGCLGEGTPCERGVP